MTGQWNYDMGAAPKGGPVIKAKTSPKTGETTKTEVWVSPTIIAAGNGQVVTLSRWMPEEGRWLMFTKDVPPMCWQPFPIHPDLEAKGAGGGK